MIIWLVFSAYIETEYHICAFVRDKLMKPNQHIVESFGWNITTREMFLEKK
jgi:hypothetical protein